MSTNDERLFNEFTMLRQQVQHLAEALQKRPERLIIFVDNTNLNFTVRKIDPNGQYRIDYIKLRDFLTAGRQLKQCRLYYSDFDLSTVLPSSEAIERQNREKFYSRLRYSGYWLQCLPLVERSDGSTKEKGLDAAIVKDIERLAQHSAMDTLVLVAGDQDYKDSVIDLQRLYGVKAEVAFFPEFTSKHLLHSASEFIDLSKVKDNIRR